MSAATYSFPVVILGGGFAGAYCARALSAGLRQAAADTVALVADQNVMLFHPMLAEVSGSSISPLHVVNPLRRFCRGAFFGAPSRTSTWRLRPCASRPRVDPKEFRLVLVRSGLYLLPQIGEKLGRYCGTPNAARTS